MGEKLRVAMIGYGFMGKVHSNAWRGVNRFFPQAPEVEMALICGRNEAALKDAAATFGWKETETDWRKVIARSDIDIIDVSTSGETHAEISNAALAAGKHVICEKPLANTSEEAQSMVKAAADAAAKGVQSMVAFNYRRVPAVAFAKQLVEQGRLGTIYHVRAESLQDWIVDPEFPLVWRLEKDKAGSGALGDIGSHIVDATQFITGSHITSVSGQMKTFIKKRPLLAALDGGLRASGSEKMGDVTVDDAAVFTANFDNGAIGVFEATRFATGHKNGMSVEISGSKGTLSFTFESMNELMFHDHTLPATEAGFRRISVTQAEHPYVAAWWPPGHILGYEHTFTHEVYDFLMGIKSGKAALPSFADGLNVQNVLKAVEASSNNESKLTKVN